MLPISPPFIDPCGPNNLIVRKCSNDINDIIMNIPMNVNCIEVLLLVKDFILSNNNCRLGSLYRRSRDVGDDDEIVGAADDILQRQNHEDLRRFCVCILCSTAPPPTEIPEPLYRLILGGDEFIDCILVRFGSLFLEGRRNGTMIVIALWLSLRVLPFMYFLIK